MADASNHASICYRLSCGTTIAGDHAFCPTCGGRMKSSRTVKRLGWLLMLCGIFLVGLIGTILFSIGPSLAHVGDSTDQGRFTGTADAAATILRLFWAIIGFGALNIGNGLYQIVSGRRSRLLSIIVLLCAVVIVVLAVITVNALPKASV